MVVFRQGEVESVRDRLVFREQLREAFVVALDEGEVLLVAQQVEGQEEEQAFLHDLIERKRLYLDERDAVAHLLSIGKVDDGGECRRRLLRAPEIEDRGIGETDVLHAVRCRRQLPRLIERDGGAVFEHPQRHLPVWCALALDVIGAAGNLQDGVRDELLLDLEMLVAQLRLGDVLRIVGMEDLVDERDHERRHLLHHGAVDIIEHGRRAPRLSARGFQDIASFSSIIPSAAGGG